MSVKRVACPVHNGGDPNCSIWRDRRGRMRARCWSHACSERAILAAIGELSADSILSDARYDPERSRAVALRLWNESRDADGTIVQRYLRQRGITMPLPASVHFHPALKHPSGSCLPAMVACVEDRNGRFLGIHRTWLRSDGTGKADIEPQKAMIGSITGGALRLAARLSETLAIAEGIETAASVMVATGIPTWAALSTSGLLSIRLPDSVRRVIIATDADLAGMDATYATARRLSREGRDVRIAYPPRGAKDFNDALVAAHTSETDHL